MTRHDKLIQERIHDPYFVKEKYHDPAVCTKCGVAFREGIFGWPEKTPENALKMVCPACKRVDDGYAGGEVLLEGAFLAKHRDEVVNIIRNAEQSEKAQRPLERIMDVVIGENRIAVKTTYEHMARRIGEAVNRAFKGELRLAYSEDDKFIRVNWTRN
jgi:hypothetical protein